MGEGTLRALKVAVVVMGVLIAGGTAALGIIIVHRMSGAPHASARLPAAETVSPASIRLDEPPGSHIGAASVTGDRLALTLQGGGPDRVIVLDLAEGRVVARVGLAP